MRIQTLAVSVVLLTCGRGVIEFDAVGAGGGTDATGGGGSATGSGQTQGGGPGADGGSVAGDLPCDVATLLTANCISCHTGSGGVVRLRSRADLAAPSVVDPALSFGERAVIRMRATEGSMPPAPASPVASAQVDAFEAWVNSGFPAGSCQTSSDAGTGDAGVPDAGPVLPFDGGIAGLPCEVSAFVAAKCASCHGSPATHGASFALLGRADFLGPSSSYAGQTIGQRSSVRIHLASNPMPPVGNPPATPSEAATFDGWVTAGMSVGTCGSIDAGVADAGPAPTTCTSDSAWDGGNRESPNMNPGLACLACHGTRAPEQAYEFSGTVYLGLHERDLCNAKPPAGVQVQIVDRTGAVALTLYPSTASGNFHSALTTGVAVPYTVRLLSAGRTATMTTPQTDGDCNACHTEQGASGALGRIVLP